MGVGDAVRAGVDDGRRMQPGVVVVDSGDDIAGLEAGSAVGGVLAEPFGAVARVRLAPAERG